MKASAIQILADENISPRVVKFLRRLGIDVLDTKEEKWHGAEDRFILEKALELKRFVLTHDSDFGNLIIIEGQRFYGIIYLRFKSQHVENVIEVLEKFFSIELDIKESQIIVVMEDKIRVRNIE